MRKKIQKKLKEKKIEDIDKFTNLLKKHELIGIVENTDIPSILINKMRNELENTSILFVKKKMLSKTYNIFNNEKDAKISDKNFFLVFTDASGLENLKKYKFETYVDLNEVIDKDVVISKGNIKNKELADLLPTINEKNIYTLEEDFYVCRKGDEINEKQLKILKLIKNKTKNLPVKLLQVYETKSINKI